MAAATTLVGPSRLKLPETSPLPPLPQRQLLHQPASTPSTAKIPHSFGNPCHDLYFHVVKDTQKSRRYLEQLLPLAWSHNPLTTLKLICNLLDSYNDNDGKEVEELFYMAALWLYQNHPKTLACNMVPIAGLGHFRNMLEILYGILDVNAEKKRQKRSQYSGFEEVNFIQKKVGSPMGWDEKKERISSKKRKEMMDMAKKAVEMYEGDPDFQLLHERVSDLYAECLKSDIQNLKEYEKQKMDNVVGPKDYLELKLTSAATWCPSVDSFYDCTTLLCESIGRKLFPREECKKGVSIEEEEEANYVSRIREQLMNEVLEPLRLVMKEKGTKDDSRRWRDGFLKQYFKDVKAGESKIEAGALLPHELVLYAHDRYLGELAEPQWKAMVEETYSKQGKFKNCLAVCDVSGRMSGHPMNVSLGMGLLVSELGDEPWKGKVFTFSRNPQLLSIQGDDLKSKCAFMRRMDNQEWDGDSDFQKVFDLILEVAVNGSLKPEQMIKRLFVFTSDQDFDDASAYRWNTDYEVIQRKFKEKGYGDVVPRIVFWNLTDDDDDYFVPVVHSAKQGVATLTGYSRNFVECFLDNDGDIGPDHVMEAAISGKQYQGLAVVD